nr:hypothetical protein [Tanacetum cinerariifolium]
LAKKLHAELEAKFAKQQEELAQKAQTERVVSPAAHGTGLLDQCCRELDVSQLIYTKADWLELMAKIGTNSALSKLLLVTTTPGGAEDSVALTTLSLKLDRCIHRVTSLENEVDVTKKVLGGVVLKLVTRVKRTSLGGDSTVEDAYTIYKASQDDHASTGASHDAAEVLDVTTMPFSRPSTTRRRLRKTVTSSAFEHFQANIFSIEDTLPAGVGIPATPPTIPTGSTPIPAGSFMDPADQAAADASTIPTATDKDKAPMVDDSLPADLLSEQERILKNLHDYQLREELAKKLHAELEAKFAKQQEELAQKAQTERVVSPAAHGTGLLDQCCRELDVSQLIYTKADWLELMAKIGTNSALSKQLLGDDVNEEVLEYLVLEHIILHEDTKIT